MNAADAFRKEAFLQGCDWCNKTKINLTAAIHKKDGPRPYTSVKL
jgi:hypothetical protein